MDPDLQLSPGIEDLCETDERAAQTIESCHDHGVARAQGRHQFAARVAIMQPLLARGSRVDEVAVDGFPDPPGVVLDDLTLGVGRGDLAIGTRADVAVHMGCFLWVHSDGDSLSRVSSVTPKRRSTAAGFKAV